MRSCAVANARRRGGQAPPRWLSADEQRAWRAFQVLSARLGAELARDLSLHSPLSYQDYVVLVALTDEPSGSLRLFELGERLGWEKSRASHQVTRMAERGLVAKRACAADGRGAVVEVTPAGREAIEAAAPSHVEAVRRLFVSQLSRAQLHQLESICNAVLEAMEHCRASSPEGPGPGAATGEAARRPRGGPGKEVGGARRASAGPMAGRSGRRSGGGAGHRSGGRR
jgi:DNA-binding MarR family transcriptional regulator